MFHFRLSTDVPIIVRRNLVLRDSRFFGLRFCVFFSADVGCAELQWYILRFVEMRDDKKKTVTGCFHTQ